MLSAVEYRVSWSLGDVEESDSRLEASDVPGEEDAADAPLLGVFESPVEDSLLESSVIK